MNERIKAIEPYGVTFYENRERPLNVRMAMASREAAKHCSVWIDEKNTSVTRHPAVRRPE